MPTFVAPGGTTIPYERHGADGPPLLLLPGLLGTIGQWRPMLPALAAGHRVVLAELRGHGRSTTPAGALAIADMVDDALGLLDELGIDSAHVAGYSLGGYVGLQLALQAPERVASVTMHATKFYWSPDSVAGTLKQLDPDAIAAKVPAYAEALAGEHGVERWGALVRQAADLVARMPAEGLSEGDASAVERPVLVSVGDRDDLVPVEEAVRLYRALERGSLQVLPGVKHPFGTVPIAPFSAQLAAFVAR